MKSIPLRDIVQQIGGRIIHGSGNPMMMNVIDWSKKEIDDHTLVFHLDREPIHGKYWRVYQSVAIISDKPDFCMDLEDSIILIQVEQVEQAYEQFVQYYRNLFPIPVIGITGTCGKTTTKEMIRQILDEEDFTVTATWRSINGIWDNVEYLLEIDQHTDVAVFEIPVVYPGYLGTACRYFQPQIRLLLNIDVHHLAGCETPEEYMKAKAEIMEGIDPESGVLILNDDDENSKKVIDVSGLQQVVYFGKTDRSDFRAKNISYADKGMNFELAHQGKSYQGYVPGYGEHNVYNALAAIAAVSRIGVEIETALHRLAGFEQVEEHLEVKTGVNGCTVIDDTWNSSPLAMATALQVLKDISQGRKTIALLGYMPQLGESEYALEQYAKMGEKAVETNLDLLIVVGEEAEEIGLSALRQGMNEHSVYFCENGSQIYKILEPHLDENAMILLKVTYRVMMRPSFQSLKSKLIPHQRQAGTDGQ
ncbi:Mur ligase family protein [Brevibacillus massiliensis]|uniref:Mur ligase family protein n=1 Tax=Brevibacillus massiliensis TaxID=1118054 RepID=UPI00030E7463|nr:UDP-N-acetylmuramoyl-tripeptide--D-alanyl-D-alanine ligase [Brevibacillus massiliensis]